VKPRQLRAFTLIELLVVISIISVLAGMLFPVFAGAQERGRQTQCISNMKQVGFALATYLQDYDDSLPLNRFPWAGHDFPDDLTGSPYNWKHAVYSIIGNKEVLQCPTNPERGRFDESQANIPQTQKDKWMPRSYAYNGSYFGEYAINRGGRPADITRVRDSTGTILLLETRSDTPELGAWSTQAYPRDSRKGLFNVHRGRMNALYADFHVKSIKLMDAYANDQFKDIRDELRGANLNAVGNSLLQSFPEYR